MTRERLTECDITGTCPYDLQGGSGGMTCRDYCGVGVDDDGCCEEDDYSNV